MGKITGSRLNSKYTVEKRFADGSNCYISVRLNHLKDRLVKTINDVNIYQHLSQNGDLIEYETTKGRVYNNVRVVN